jgi:iron(II)-dependent oxidoreductase
MTTSCRFSLSLVLFLASVALAGGSARERAACEAGMAFIPPGDFLMGREDNRYDLLKKKPRDKDDDRPVHQVWIDGFYMDRFEVTNLEYHRFTEAAGRSKPWHWVEGIFGSGAAGKPVYNVDWFDAVAYCEWMGKRLPTEAEWEKAARGGLELKFYPNGGTAFYSRRGRGGEDDEGGSGGDEDDVFEKDNPIALRDPYRPKEDVPEPEAVYDLPFGPEMVGTKKPNGYGLYDMAGNVLEWCSDWFGLAYYRESPDRNPKGPVTGLDRILRGGSWVDGSEDITVYFRNHALPDTRSPAIGIRCACDGPARAHR